MDINQRIKAFSKLGTVLKDIGTEKSFANKEVDLTDFEKAFDRSIDGNAWFTPGSIFSMLHAMGSSLNAEDLQKWTGQYDLKNEPKAKTVAVIMAGNIPAVGFHDFLSVLMTGHRLLAKLSSDDQHLLPAIADILTVVEPSFKDQITFTTENIKDFDAVIATGSNNTSRYFNYYFGKYPHIIRKNRNAIAVLGGHESKDDLIALAEDIFAYYGLGCRNVSRLFVPEDYDFKNFYEGIEAYSGIGDHHKYRNNYDYNKSVFLVNGEPHFDNGFLILKENEAIASPVSVMHYERYKNLDEVNSFVNRESENIQCVVSALTDVQGGIPPGSAQHPKLWDYADGVDTIEFLLNL